MFVRESWDQEILDKLEEQFRTGYHHGYLAALRDPNLENDIKEWRYQENREICKPPGDISGCFPKDGVKRVKMDENNCVDRMPNNE